MNKGRIHHVGNFNALEDEMCLWLPGDPSPNRMDALVWALTELMLKSRHKEWIWVLDNGDDDDDLYFDFD